MSEAKHLLYFSKSSNHFENERQTKEGTYFFHLEITIDKRDSILADNEAAIGIIYDKSFGDLVATVSSGANGRLFSLLLENGFVNEEVKKYINRLKADWKKKNDKVDAIRLIDFHIIFNNIDEAHRIRDEAGVKHDLLAVREWAEREGVKLAAAVATWGALCSSPISRAIARSYLCQLTDVDALQIQIAGHAEFISLQDAFVLGSVFLGNEHPVTKRLHRKWASDNTDAFRLPAKSPSKQLPDVVDSEPFSNSKKDLIFTYRSLMCRLPKPTGLRFNSVETVQLRHLWIRSIMAGNWEVADAMAKDITTRFTGTEHGKDTLALISAFAQVFVTVLGLSDYKEETEITRLLQNGGSLKDVMGVLKDTIFTKPFEDGEEEEMSDVFVAVDSIIRAVRAAFKKMDDLSLQIKDFFSQVLELANSFAKLLLDFDTVIDAIKPIFTTNEKLLRFFTTDLGHQFNSRIQNERMKGLMALSKPTDEMNAEERIDQKASINSVNIVETVDRAFPCPQMPPRSNEVVLEETGKEERVDTSEVDSIGSSKQSKDAKIERVVKTVPSGSPDDCEDEVFLRALEKENDDPVENAELSNDSWEDMKLCPKQQDAQTDPTLNKNVVAPSDVMMTSQSQGPSFSITGWESSEELSNEREVKEPEPRTRATLQSAAPAPLAPPSSDFSAPHSTPMTPNASGSVHTTVTADCDGYSTSSNSGFGLAEQQSTGIGFVPRRASTSQQSDEGNPQRRGFGFRGGRSAGDDFSNRPRPKNNFYGRGRCNGGTGYNN